MQTFAHPITRYFIIYSNPFHLGGCNFSTFVRNLILKWKISITNGHQIFSNSSLEAKFDGDCHNALLYTLSGIRWRYISSFMWTFLSRGSWLSLSRLHCHIKIFCTLECLKVYVSTLRGIPPLGFKKFQPTWHRAKFWLQTTWESQIERLHLIVKTRWLLILKRYCRWDFCHPDPASLIFRWFTEGKTAKY